MNSPTRAIIASSFAWSLLLSACVVQKVSRDIIEPLPEGLEVAAVEDIEPGRVEGWGLCMIIVANGDLSSDEILGQLAEHLQENKNWQYNPLFPGGLQGQVHLLRPDEGPGSLWTVQHYLQEWPEGHCSSLIERLEDGRDGVVLLM